jgi:hypothetical protein
MSEDCMSVPSSGVEDVSNKLLFDAAQHPRRYKTPVGLQSFYRDIYAFFL